MPASTSLRRAANRAERRRQAIGGGVRVVVDGVAYTIHVGQLSAADAAALRRETGMSISGLLRAVQSDPDIDIIAALVWLARRQDGDRVSYEDVAAEISYDTDMSTEALPPADRLPDPVRVVEDGDSSPEA